MAFLRSVSRCNLVSRQISSSRIELSRVDTRNLLNKSFSGENELMNRCLSSSAAFPPANKKSGSDGLEKNKNIIGREQSTTTVIGQRDPLDTGFADPKAAFKSKTTIELIRAYIVYTLCSSEFLVDNNMKVRFLSFNYLENVEIFGCRII